MNITEPYEPAAWDLFCRRQMEGGMLDLLTIRSGAARKAAADGYSSDMKRREMIDAEVAETIRVRAMEVEYWSSKAVEAATRTGQIESFSEDPDGRLPPCGHQKVVPLKRPAKISSVPQPEYYSLTWSDAITENMECVDRIARGLEEENGGKRSKRHEKLLLQKYFQALGSPQTGSIGRSGYPEHIEKRVNRYLWLEQAFESGRIVYPNGYPTAFSLDEQQTLQSKLRAAGVPKDGIQQLIGSLRKFVKRNSKRPWQH
jgi:hypothetical protein